jgi:hypothetical protein
LRDTGGDRDHAQNVAGRFFHKLLGFDLRANLIGKINRTLQFRLRQDHGELLAAIARGGVAAL